MARERPKTKNYPLSYPRLQNILLLLSPADFLTTPFQEQYLAGVHLCSFSVCSSPSGTASAPSPDALNRAELTVTQNDLVMLRDGMYIFLCFPFGHPPDLTVAISKSLEERVQDLYAHTSFM